MRDRIEWAVLAFILVLLLSVGSYLAYEFVTALRPGALDCTITWGRAGC